MRGGGTVIENTGGYYLSQDSETIEDRFHLLKNLLDDFERFLSRQHQVIAEIFQNVFPSVRRSSKETKPLPSAAKKLKIEQKAAHTATREKRFQTVKQLHQEGMPIPATARRLKISRNTVKRSLAVKSALQRQPNCPRFSPIQRFLPYLQKRRTEEGERSSRQLWKEIKAQGYPGAEATLRHFLQKWREAEEAEIRVQTIIKANAPGRAPSIKQIKRLLFGSKEKPKEQWE